MVDTIDSFTGEYFFLSNFYYEAIDFEGLWFPTNEHAFQAAKSLDNEDRVEIQQQPTPAAARARGRRVKLRSHWDCYWRYKVMQQLIDEKFDRSELLAAELRNTGDAVLIEGNHWGDTTWGMVRRSTPSMDGQQWYGHNILGWMLMEKREELLPAY